MNSLFEIIPEAKDDGEEVYKPSQFDLLKYEGGAFYLTRDGDRADIIILNAFRNHFFEMGERDRLVGKALELYHELLLVERLKGR